MGTANEPFTGTVDSNIISTVASAVASTLPEVSENMLNMSVELSYSSL